jgi:hypothetical protein
MTVLAEKKFAVEIIYNGVTKPLQVESEERVAEVLRKAIALFGITQNAHLLSLFRQDGSVVPDEQTVERAGLKPGEILLLRPNAVRGGEGLLHLAEGVIAKTFGTLRKCGRGQCECAVFWTGPADAAVVDGVEHPIHKRSPFGYEVDDGWLTNFWKQLAASSRSVRVQIHTHPGRAFHSATDDEWPIVSQAGFISIVIPNYATGEPSLDGAWVGRLRKDGEWERLPSFSDAVLLT